MKHLKRIPVGTTALIFTSLSYGGLAVYTDSTGKGIKEPPPVSKCPALWSNHPLFSGELHGGGELFSEGLTL